MQGGLDMRKTLAALGMMTILCTSLAACGGNPSATTGAGGEATTSAPTAIEETGSTEGSTEAAAGADSAEATTGKGKAQTSESDAISIYFSRVGNTDFPEGIDADTSASINLDGQDLKGNAQMMAEWIAEEAGCDTCEIVAEASYPADYDETVDQAREEQGAGDRPKIKDLSVNLADYNTIYLSVPNWWGDLPMPVYTFFDENDLAGKKIVLFATHEGSGFSGMVDTVGELEPDAEVVEALSVRGGDVTDQEQDIKQWVKDNQ